MIRTASNRIIIVLLGFCMLSSFAVYAEETFDMKGEWEDKGVMPNALSPGKLVLPKPRWTTLYIGKGKKDKVNRVDVVGFLSKIGGLERAELGRVDVGDHFVYAAVARERVEEVLKRVRGQKIKGVKTIIERAY